VSAVAEMNKGPTREGPPLGVRHPNVFDLVNAAVARVRERLVATAFTPQ